MDWYFGSGIDDLIVPEDGGLSDRLPSPDSWSKWGISGPEIFQSQHKCGAFAPEFTATEEDGFDAKSLSGDSVRGRYYDWSAISSRCGGVSDESPRALGNRLDYQLDLVGSGRVDDIFLSSLNEDLPRIENPEESFCSSPESQRGATKLSTRTRERSSVSQNASSDVPSRGSSQYLKTRGFSQSLGWENDCSPDSDIVAYHLQGKSDLFIKDPSIVESVLSENNNANRLGDEETSLEEAVLSELKMVMNQLTEKARISFRDALYRLAKNSDQQRMTQNQCGDLFMEIHPHCSLDVEMESTGTNIVTESETNVIDRAIASLMFSKMDFNVRDLPSAVSSNFKESVVALSKPFDYRPCLTQRPRDSNDGQIPLDDAKVPIFGQMYPCPTADLKSGVGSRNRTIVLDFSSVAK